MNSPTRIATIIALILTSGIAYAADPKYASPTIPSGDHFEIKFDAAPTVTWNNTETALNISYSGIYNYMDDHAFQKLEIEVKLVEGGIATNRGITIFSPESSLGVPGIFSGAFGNIAPPGQNQSLIIVARLTIKKGNNAAISDIDSKQLIAPAKTGGGGPIGD